MQSLPALAAHYVWQSQHTLLQVFAWSGDRRGEHSWVAGCPMSQSTSAWTFTSMGGAAPAAPPQLGCVLQLWSCCCQTCPAVHRDRTAWPARLPMVAAQRGARGPPKTQLRVSCSSRVSLPQGCGVFPVAAPLAEVSTQKALRLPDSPKQPPSLRFLFLARGSLVERKPGASCRRRCRSRVSGSRASASKAARGCCHQNRCCSMWASSCAHHAPSCDDACTASPALHLQAQRKC